MMRSVAAGYESAIAASCVKTADIFDFALADGNTHYYTNHSEDFQWGAGGNTYLSSHITHGPVESDISGEVVTVKMQLLDLEGTIFQNIHLSILDGAVITAKHVLWNRQYAVGWEIPYFVGRPHPAWDRRGLSLECKSIFGGLNIMVPRNVYQPPCNWILFETLCGLNRDDYAYSGTAGGGSRTTLVDAARGTVYKVEFDDATGTLAIGDTITGSIGAGTGVVIQVVYDTATSGRLWYVEQSGVQFVDDEVLASGANDVTANGAPAEDTTFHELGELEMLTGASAGHRRPVLSNSGSTVTLFWPLPSAVKAGDTYRLFPGCDKRAVTCAQRFGNDPNWRGYPYPPGSVSSLFGPVQRYDYALA